MRPFVVINRTNLGAKIVVAQALCLIVFNSNPTTAILPMIISWCVCMLALVCPCIAIFRYIHSINRDCCQQPTPEEEQALETSLLLDGSWWC